MISLGSLCTGYGGLDLAAETVLGTETVWLSEVDPNASTICASRFPGVPNLGDLTAVDWSLLEPVEVLTAGYPCQPFSTAGKRQGTNDDRHIWPYICDALRVLRPRLALFENVAGHLSLGFDAVLADLASIGFDAEWCVVRASDVGACHQRKRLFVVATDAEGEQTRRVLQRGVRADDHAGRDIAATDTDSASGEAWGQRPRSGDARRLQSVDGGDPDAADTDGTGPQGRGRDALAPREVQAAAHDRRTATDADSEGVEGAGRSRASRRGESLRDGTDWGAFDPAIDRHARLTGRPAPTPTDDRGRLSALFVEWMMCLPEGWVTDILPRNPALKALGNGVVPPQAAYAIGHLVACAERPPASAVNGSTGDQA